MLKTVRRAFQIDDIRRKIFYTLAMLVVVRLGSQLPTPGVDPTYIQNFFESQSGDTFNFFNAFTGGSFEQMSIFALSITPYITSSIIMQLLTIAIPRLEEMQKEGEDGRKKITAITRYVTVLLALIQSTAMAVGFGRQGLLVEFNFVNAAIVVLTLTAGSAFLMWIGERITEKGVGNGGERRIPVQYSQKVQGRKAVGGQSSSIPLKVNTAGVIPVIFASSLMQTPVVIASFLGRGNGTGIGSQILRGLTSSYWCNPQYPYYSWGLAVYILLTVFFAYFYTSITFNPLEIANNMKKSGGFIPGIRPGKPTVDYLQNILHYIIFIGACGLVIIQVIPFIFQGTLGASVSFGGTSLIIIIGVVLETVKQIESQMLVRNYTGFLNSKGNGMKNSFLGY